MVRHHAIKFWIQDSFLKASYSLLVANILRKKALIWNSVFKCIRNQSNQVLQTELVSVVRVAVLCNVLFCHHHKLKSRAAAGVLMSASEKSICGWSHRSLKALSLQLAMHSHLLNMCRYCSGYGRKKAWTVVASSCLRSGILTTIIPLK